MLDLDMGTNSMKLDIASLIGAYLEAKRTYGQAYRAYERAREPYDKIQDDLRAQIGEARHNLWRSVAAMYEEPEIAAARDELEAREQEMKSALRPLLHYYATHLAERSEDGIVDEATIDEAAIENRLRALGYLE